MKYILSLLLILPTTTNAQKFYVMDADDRIIDRLENRIAYLGYVPVDDAKGADFKVELVYEKKKGYMSFKSGYQKVGFIRFLSSNDSTLAETDEQGGVARGYNTYSSLSQLVNKILKTDFDSTIKYVASTFTPKKINNKVAGSSTADELIKLKKLLDEGALTKEEFEAQKKKLLGE